MMQNITRNQLMKIQREHWFQMPWFEDHMMPNLVHTNNHNIFHNCSNDWLKVVDKFLDQLTLIDKWYWFGSSFRQKHYHKYWCICEICSCLRIEFGCVRQVFRMGHHLVNFQQIYWNSNINLYLGKKYF